MFKELHTFKEISAQLDKQIDELEEKLSAKREAKHKLETQYEKMLDDNSTILAINEVKQKISDSEDEIQLMEEKISRLRKNKTGKLAQTLDDVRKGYEREAADISEKILPLFEKVREHRAKMLLVLQEASVYYQSAAKLFRELREAERLAGQRQSHNMRIPEIASTMTDQRNGKDLVNIGLFSSSEELMIAYHTGQTPEWVQRYADSE